jgi:hypothetical protein
VTPSTFVGLWGVELALFFLLIRSVRERRRIARLGEAVAEGAGRGRPPSRTDRGRHEQWPELARQLSREGMSRSELERLRRQLFE